MYSGIRELLSLVFESILGPLFDTGKSNSKSKTLQKAKIYCLF